MRLSPRKMSGRIRSFVFVCVGVLIGLSIVLFLASASCTAQEPVQGPVTDAIKAVRELREANKQSQQKLSALGDRLAASERERRTLFKRLEEIVESTGQERKRLRDLITSSEGRVSNLSKLFENERSTARAERKTFFERLREYQEENGTLRERIANNEGIIQGFAKRIFYSVAYLFGALVLVIGLGSFVYIRFRR